MKSDPYLKLHIKINSRAWGDESVGVSTLCAPSIHGVHPQHTSMAPAPAAPLWEDGQLDLRGPPASLAEAVSLGSRDPVSQRKELGTLLGFFRYACPHTLTN